MFPLDPNAPKRKNKFNFWNIIEKLFTIVSILIAVISLLYSSISFNLSKKAYESSINQFEQNSNSADIQFKQISSLLKSYQKIADSSLLVTNHLLLTTRQLLDQQVGSFKPYVGVYNSDYLLTDDELNQKLVIAFNIINTGGRTAYQVHAKFIYLNMKFNVLREFTSKSLDLIPNTPKGIGDFLSIKKGYKFEYYLFIKIEYYDDILKKKFYTMNVYKPSKLISTFEEVELNIKNEILNRYKNYK